MVDVVPLVLLAVAAWHDLRTREIPDGISLALAAWALGGAVVSLSAVLVYIGVATAGQVATRELRLSGDRRAIMDAATLAAVELALELTQPDPSDAVHATA